MTLDQLRQYVSEDEYFYVSKAAIEGLMPSDLFREANKAFRGKNVTMQSEPVEETEGQESPRVNNATSECVVVATVAHEIGRAHV